jgi:hypothetical protein
LTAFSTVLGIGSVIIGVIVSVLTIQRFRKDRKLGIFLEFNKLLYDKEFIQDINEIETWIWDTVGDFFMKYGPEINPEGFAKFIRVTCYFDGLSTLVQRKFIDIKLVPETTAIMLIRFWEKIQSIRDGLAMVFKRPDCWESIEHLYNNLQKIEIDYYRELKDKHVEETHQKGDEA